VIKNNLMKNDIVNFIDNNPLEAGIIFMIIAILMLIYKFYKKGNVSFKNSTLMGWKTHVYFWLIVCMSISYSLILIFRGL